MSAGRLAIGVALLAAPRLVIAPWVGARHASRTGSIVLARALGARDAAIGAGVLAALAGGGSLRPWLLAGLAADATDLAVTLSSRDDLPDGAVPMIGSAATSGVLLGLAALAGDSGGHSAPVPA